MKTTNTLLALAVAASAPAVAQQTQILTAEKHNEYGLVYTLPKTALAIEVTAQKRVATAGPFFQYAKKHIGTDNVVKENITEWTVTSISVTPYGIADDSQQYLMQLKPGSSTYIGADSDGVILSINAEPLEADEVHDNNSRDVAEQFDANEYLQYVNEDFLSSQSTATRAKMLAENIMEVRDAKISLTRGTADNMPSDGRQLELMLNSLTHQEESMTKAFTGDVTTTTETHTYYYTPGAEGSDVLFRLSDFDGFTTADDYAGEPVRISVEITSRPELPKDEKGDVKRLPKDAVIYKIPGKARVKLTWRGKTLYDREMEMGQYGVTFGLNPTLFTDKKAPSYARFSPVTGAVEAIGPVSDLER